MSMTTERRSVVPPVVAALRETAGVLVAQIEDAIADPAEYIPSRIRHQAREVRAVLDSIDRLERGRGSAARKG